MAEPPTREFGKRRPVVAKVPPTSVTPVKRSGHVALLLMGTVAVGGGAYALAVRNNCEPAPPGIAAPASPGMAPSPQAATSCTSRGYSSGGGSGGSGSSWSRRSSFFGGDSGSSSSSSGTASGSGGVTRGGFGSFAHAFAGHFGGS